MKNYPQLFLNTRKAGSFLGQHPWVLEKSIIDPTFALEPGNDCRLDASEREFGSDAVSTIRSAAFVCVCTSGIKRASSMSSGCVAN